MRTNGSNGARDIVQLTTRRCNAVRTTMHRNAKCIACQVRAASVSMTSRTFPLHRRVASRQPLPMSWMTRMRMLFLSSYQHFRTQSQCTYHNDGIAFLWIRNEQCQ